MFPYHRQITGLILFGLLALSLPLFARGEVYEEMGKQHAWFSFSKPAKKSPSEQMEYAEGLLKKEKLKKAGKAFHALAITWPSAPEAPAAQWAYARTLDMRGKKEDAFNEYQKLIEKFPGRFLNYDQIALRQFELAKEIMSKKKGAIIFGGFEAPERAIPLFETVIKNGPRAPFAAEAQYLIGMAYEKSFQYELAVVAYIATVHRYPGSEFAERAAFGRTRSLYQLSKDYPNDIQALEEAWAGVMVFLRAFPVSDQTEEVLRMRDELLDRKAKITYDVADYYDRIAKRPEAALALYEDFVERFPRTRWTEAANARRDALATNENEHVEE